MNVKELREFLQDLPDEMEVILQKDAEGNGFSPLEGLSSDCVYTPTTTWFGEVHDTKWTADEACMSEEELAEMNSKPRSLILYPVN